MERSEIIARRLENHGLCGTRFATALDVVRSSLAVQAQDYPGAKWSVGQRLDGVTDADLDRLFDEGAILRTHLLRPTWHFVLPEDVRWLIALTAPRVQAANRSRYRELGLDDATRERGRETIHDAIATGGPQTRKAIGEALAAAGIDPTGQRLTYLLMDAELEAVVCSGPRQGKQHTHALFDDRVPPGPERDRDDMLAELATRYVTSHGPVTPHDLSWWSGLTVIDARRGLELAGDRLACVEMERNQWWLAPVDAPTLSQDAQVHLLQPWDEYALGFRDQNPVWAPDARAMQHPKGALWNASLIALDGRVSGGWRRQAAAREVHITTILPSPLPSRYLPGLERAAACYGTFLGMPVSVTSA